MFFFKNIKVSNKYYATWVLIFQLAALFAALDSCLVLFNPVKSAFIGLGLSNNFSNGFTIGLIVVYLVVVDYALSVFYPNAINEGIQDFRNGQKSRAKWAITVMTIIYCVAAIAITVTVSFSLRHTSASLAIESPTLLSVDSITSVQKRNDAKVILNLESEIKKVESEKERAISRSQNNIELKRLAENGNGWAKQQLQERERNAAAKFNEQLSSLRNQKTTLLGQNSQNLNVIATSTEKTNEFNRNQYAAKTESLAAFLMWFSIISTGFQCFAGIMIALFRALYGLGKTVSLTVGGNYQDKGNNNTTSNYGNAASNYQMNTDKLQYEGKYYEPTAIKRWAQNSDRRAESAKTDEKKQYFESKAAELWDLWNNYEASKTATAA